MNILLAPFTQVATATPTPVPYPTLALISPEALLVQSHLITLGTFLLVLIILAGVLWNARKINKPQGS